MASGPSTARQVLGLSLLGLGVIGTLLPVIPGIPLLVAGAAILGPQHRLVRPVATWLRRRTSRPDRRAGPAPPGEASRKSVREP